MSLSKSATARNSLCVGNLVDTVTGGDDSSGVDAAMDAAMNVTHRAGGGA